MAPPTTPQFRIPTLDKLGATLPADIEIHAARIAEGWFKEFAQAISIGDTEALLNIFCEDALWRDVYAFTWDIRTFDGSAKIKSFLEARLPVTEIHTLEWKDFVRYQKPFPDTAWILGLFGLETRVTSCTVVFRIVPTSTGKWKAYTIFTNLDNLTRYPELIGKHRRQDALPSDQWSQERQQEMNYKQSPPVIIVGAGLSGLALAARLKYLGVPALLVEKDARIGDSWRKRYDSLCLHFPIWFDHMPYLPFPPTWPRYTPALKMAEWLECYARLLDLNVWTSSTVVKSALEDHGKWTVQVQRSDSQMVTYHGVSHFVIATGQGDSIGSIPRISNESSFQGSIIHSSQYKRAEPYRGKKVLVIGAGNSGHDIASDLAKEGIDVTLLQRSSTFVMNLDKGWKYIGGAFELVSSMNGSRAALYHEGGPPVETADLLTHSMPHLLLEGGVAQRGTRAVMADQKDLLAALNKVGYRTNSGVKDAGILLNLKQRGGGHYFDVGATKLIIDREIKVKSGTQIKAYEEHGVQFEDGSSLDADVVIFATGAGDMRYFIRLLCGDDIADRCPPMLGLNVEGEMSWFRPLPVDGLWYMHGQHSNAFAISS
ncbi:hypothetical protein CVT26_014640 [Gymnopilus dilepis]|uniref:FAD/NAD(P)-binding domain-containing protein n=1 Tax=Gymnopilus dilepis TaxID=231916 RepID=A0A409W3G1_9AGAR|nr:hypothetical protein CVT26_014640 [Gymnopilus dilepis]